MVQRNLKTHKAWRAAHPNRDEIGQQLRMISTLTREIGKQVGETLGVHVTDIAALEHLLHEGPARPSQLAERLKVTTAAATQIVDRLERAGHVQRERQADDRRTIFVVPVEASVERAFAQLSPMLEALDGVVSKLPTDERHVIERFLRQVVEVYRSIADPPRPPLKGPD